jgi:prevent-host-death family protein
LIAAMSEVSARELIHHFAAIASRVAAGEELTVTRHGKPLLRLTPLQRPPQTEAEREALLRKALGFQMTRPYGKPFARSDAYDEA